MMRKSINRFFSLLLALAMVFSMVPVTSLAADTACDSNTLGTFNGSPACVDADGKLHLCASNFPDPNFLAYVTEYGGDGNMDGYVTVEEADCIRTIACENRNITTLEGIQFYTSLHELVCSENPLTELDVSKNAALIYLQCNNCTLEQLDVSSLSQLYTLEASNNALVRLDVSNNSNLQSLSCHSNQLTQLDVTANTKLWYLNCSYNLLTSLQLHTCSMLELLECYNNQLTSLNVLNQPLLRYLVCHDNQLTALNVSNNKALTSLNTWNNQISQLDISANPALEVLCAENNKLTALDASNNLKLMQIDVPNNRISQLDISGCTELTELDLENNCLTSIDLSSSIKLTNLNLRNNALTEVDISALQELNIAQFCKNALTELDVSNNTKLQQLSFPNNKISAIDLSNNPEIFSLICNNNRLTELDVSNLTDLRQLNCYFNQLATLDLNANVNLNDVSLDSQFVHTTVPYTRTENGYEVDLRDLAGDKWNMIYSVSNCHSFDSTTGIATFENEPFALDYWYTASANYTMYVSYGDVPYHDPVTFPAHADLENGELKLNSENFPDADFLVCIKNIADGDESGTISPEEAGLVHEIRVVDCGINSLKGIEFFSNLRILECQTNELTELDVSANQQLTSLSCSDNPITKLTLGNLPKLRELSCGSTKLTSVDVSGCTELRYLYCPTNRLTSIDVSMLTKLTQLYVYENQLTELDVSANTQLKELHCSDNRLTALDLSNNTDLTDLSCTDNQLLTLDVSNATLTNFNGSSQRIPGVIISTYKDGNYEVDMAAIVGENNIQNIDSIQNTYSYDPSTGIAVFWEDPYNLTYSYRVDSNNIMNVEYGQFAPTGPVTFPAGATLVNGELALTDDNFPDSNFLSVIMGYDYDNSSGLSAAEAGQIYNLSLDCLNISDLTGIGYFTNLTELNCNTNQLTALDLSCNVNLITLYCSENNLKTLDLSKNALLRNLYCGNSGLTELDLSSNTELRRLHVSQNKLTALDVSMLSTLAELYVNENSLTALDVSQNALLRELNAAENKLTALDVSNNTRLINLSCYRNRLTALDLSANTQLTDIQIHDQSVPATLNAIRNGEQYMLDMGAIVGTDNLSKITSIDNSNFYDTATGMVSFSFDPITINYCIEPVPGYPMSVAYGEVPCTDPVVFPADAVLVNGELAIIEDNFPDPAFRAYMSNFAGENGSLSAQEAGRITELSIEANNIADLTGIEYFTNLYRLNCSNNPITTLDLSKNTQLIELSFNDSSVSSVNLTGLTKLRYLSCSNTQLTALDVSDCTELRTLYCSEADLTTLDASMLTKVTEIYATGCQLTSLNVSGCKELRQLSCYSNQLTSLSLNNLPSLNALDVRDNALTSLDVTAIPSLQHLTCSGNPLLYLNAPDSVDYLEFDNANIEGVISSVYTDNGYAVDMSALVGKDNLARITYVDRANQYDPATGIATFLEEPFAVRYHYQANGQYQISVNYGELPPSGPVAGFTGGCTNADGELELCEHNFPDAAFRQLIINNGWDWDGNNHLSVYEAGNINDLHCSGWGITSLKGIEHFTNLYSLNCSYLQITELDLSKNIHLVEVSCENNSLTSLNVSTNAKLRVLDCSDNRLTALDIAGNPQLRQLDLSENALTQIDLSNNSSLTELQCYGNQLTALDVSNNTNLKELYCSENKLTSIDLSNNPSLTMLYCYTNQLTELNVSNNTNLKALNFCENKLTSIDLSSNSGLTELSCYGNRLTALDVSHLTDLHHLDVSENCLAYLDVSKNSNLQDGYFGEQTVEQTVISVAADAFYTVDMSQFVGSLYSNIRSVEDAEYDPSTGIATFAYKPTSVTYMIDPGMANRPEAEMLVYAGCIHDWSEPTCTTPKTCSKCQATDGDVYHSWKAATCSAPKTCTLCGATEGVAAEDHKYGIWIVDKAPTATEEGTRHRTCNGCDDTQVQAIEKLTVTEENPNGGRIENITSPGENAYAGQINHDAEELIEKLLTDEEKQAISDGALVNITLTVDDILDTISYQDISLIEEVFDDISGVFGPNPLNLGMALDINLYKQVGTNAPEKITRTNPSDGAEFNQPVMVSLDLPEELRYTELFGFREYLVIRIHEGEPEILMGMYDEQTHQLTFETDAFSTYSVVYADIPQNPIVDWNLTLGSNIGVNFYSYMEEDVAKRVQVRITAAGKTTLVNAIDAPKDERELYTFGVKLAAAQMADIIQLEILVDGEVYSTEEYSIREYALYMLNTGYYDDCIIELLVTMLNYGAMAQLYFDYNTEHLANEGVEMEGFAEIPQPENPMSVTGSLPGIRYHGATLLFNSNTAVRFYFQITGNIDDYDFSIDGITPTEEEGLYYIEVANINPQDLDKLIELTVSMGEDSFSVSYSPLLYIYRMSNRSSNAALRNLLQAMYSYHVAAETYVDRFAV